MRPLGWGLDVSVLSLLFLLLFAFGRAKGEGDGLSTQQTNPLTAHMTAWPIAPKDWGRSELRRRKHWRRLTEAL
jgi:hypothetical protein